MTKFVTTDSYISTTLYSSDTLIAANNDNKFKQQMKALKTMWH